MPIREHTILRDTPLPTGYTRLKWIGCNGTVAYNHIETDFQALNTFVIEGEFSYYNNIGGGNDGTWICGNNSQGNSRQCYIACFRTVVDGVYVLGIDTVFGTYAGGDKVVDEPLDVNKTHTFRASRSEITFDGHSVSRSYSSSSTSNFRIFQVENGGIYQRTNKHKLYWLSISDINTDDLLHYFLPAMRDLDSKLGVYDTTTNRFYDVIGTSWQYEI